MLCLKPFTWQYLTLVSIQLVLSPWAFRNALPLAGAVLPQGEEDRRQGTDIQACLGLAVMGNIDDICGRIFFFIFFNLQIDVKSRLLSFV